MCAPEKKVSGCWRSRTQSSTGPLWSLHNLNPVILTTAGTNHSGTATVSSTRWPRFYTLAFSYIHFSETTPLLWFYATLRNMSPPFVARNHAVSVSTIPAVRAAIAAARDSIRSPGELGLSSPGLSVKVCSWPDRTPVSFSLLGTQRTSLRADVR